MRHVFLKKAFSFCVPNKRPITSNWGNKTIKKISAELQHVHSWSHQCCFVSFPSKNYKKHFWLWHDKALKQIPLAQQWLVHDNWPARCPHISHCNHFSCFRKHFGLLSWHQPIRTVGHHGDERKEIKTFKKNILQANKTKNKVAAGDRVWMPEFASQVEYTALGTISTFVNSPLNV